MRDGSAKEHSASHIPDVGVHQGDDVICADTKCVNPLKKAFTDIKRDAQRGAFVSLANTWEEQFAVVSGRPELRRPDGATNCWSRINGTGHISAVTAQYVDAQSKDNPVHCCLIEALCGTFSPGMCDFIELCASQHMDDSVNPAHLGYSWTAPSFTQHHSLLISTAFHRGLAREMLRSMGNVTRRRPTKFGSGKSQRRKDRHACGRRPFTLGDFPCRATSVGRGASRSHPRSA